MRNQNEFPFKSKKKSVDNLSRALTSRESPKAGYKPFLQSPQSRQSPVTKVAKSSGRKVHRSSSQSISIDETQPQLSPFTSNPEAFSQFQSCRSLQAGANNLSEKLIQNLIEERQFLTQKCEKLENYLKNINENAHSKGGFANQNLEINSKHTKKIDAMAAELEEHRIRMQQLKVENELLKQQYDTVQKESAQKDKLLLRNASTPELQQLTHKLQLQNRELIDLRDSKERLELKLRETVSLIEGKDQTIRSYSAKVLKSEKMIEEFAVQLHELVTLTLKYESNCVGEYKKLMKKIRENFAEIKPLDALLEKIEQFAQSRTIGLSFNDTFASNLEEKNEMHNIYEKFSKLLGNSSLSNQLAIIETLHSVTAKLEKVVGQGSDVMKKLESNFAGEKERKKAHEEEVLKKLASYNEANKKIFGSFEASLANIGRSQEKVGKENNQNYQVLLEAVNKISKVRPDQPLLEKRTASTSSRAHELTEENSELRQQLETAKSQLQAQSDASRHQTGKYEMPAHFDKNSSFLTISKAIMHHFELLEELNGQNASELLKLLAEAKNALQTVLSSQDSHATTYATHRAMFQISTLLNNTETSLRTYFSQSEHLGVKIQSLFSELLGPVNSQENSQYALSSTHLQSLEKEAEQTPDDQGQFPNFIIPTLQENKSQIPVPTQSRKTSWNSLSLTNADARPTHTNSKTSTINPMSTSPLILSPRRQSESSSQACTSRRNFEIKESKPEAPNSVTERKRICSQPIISQEDLFKINDGYAAGGIGSPVVGYPIQVGKEQSSVPKSKEMIGKIIFV